MGKERQLNVEDLFRVRCWTWKEYLIALPSASSPQPSLTAAHLPLPTQPSRSAPWHEPARSVDNTLQLPDDCNVDRLADSFHDALKRQTERDRAERRDRGLSPQWCAASANFP